LPLDGVLDHGGTTTPAAWHAIVQRRLLRLPMIRRSLKQHRSDRHTPSCGTFNISDVFSQSDPPAPELRNTFGAKLHLKIATLDCTHHSYRQLDVFLCIYLQYPLSFGCTASDAFLPLKLLFCPMFGIDFYSDLFLCSDGVGDFHVERISSLLLLL
jgi:hypothetical protein